LSSSPKAASSSEERRGERAEPSGTVAQLAALGMAESYIETLHLSKAGLPDQMTSEYGSQFEEADAKWAVDQIFGE
jgi:hypothetical protein